ncbi:MAG: response regulator [Flavobacteriaceae bacterium]|nr:MAG: response regulator [Flavobacteriaceae bacterium]
MKEFNAICIIDDDPITVFGIKKMLSIVTKCDNIITYYNGKLAIDGLREIVNNNEDIPDIIFLDINMPIMDGWQFLEEFIAIPMKKKIRINIVTSSIDPLDIKKAEMYKSMSHHTVVFNNKPITRSVIEEITNAA